MATYNEKYYWQGKRENGVVFRLSILQRSWTGTAKEIGDFRDLKIDLQGSQANLEEPIVKSSCFFSMVDSRDKTDTSSVKYGAWEEFFTPDQTLYLVRVSVAGSVIWSGYITPDSWDEDLIYRGIIGITARDMLGHMDDFEVIKEDFSTIASDNMASVINIIGKGLALAEVPMSLTYYSTGDTDWMTYETQKLYDWAIDVTSLYGMSWYQAVESILDSLGLTLRYSGRNLIVLSPIRNVPLCGYQSASSVPVKTAQILRRSGHRSIVPAYKRIIERVSYEPMDDLMETFTDADFVSVSGGKRLEKEGWTTAQGEANVILPFTAQNTYNDIVGDSSRYFVMHLGDHTQGGGSFTKLVAPKTQVTISFKLAHGYKLNNGTLVPAQDNLFQGVMNYYIQWEKPDGTILWLNTAWVWQETQRDHTYLFDQEVGEASIDINVATPDVPGKLRITFAMKRDSSDTDNTKYVRVGEFSVSVNPDGLPQSLNVKTIYDDSQNTTLKRNPDFGQLPAWLQTAGAIKNGLYKMAYSANYPPIQNVKWNNAGSALPVSVLVHMQHIAMHAKANSVITAELRDLSADNPNFNSLWSLFERTFILIGGSYNLVSGFVEDATLIEYDDYDDVWGDISVDYSYNNSAGVYKGSGSSSGATISGGGGGGGGTTVSWGTETEDHYTPLNVGGTVKNLPTEDTMGYFLLKDEAEETYLKLSGGLVNGDLTVGGTLFTNGGAHLKSAYNDVLKLNHIASGATNVWLRLMVNSNEMAHMEASVDNSTYKWAILGDGDYFSGYGIGMTGKGSSGSAAGRDLVKIDNYVALRLLDEQNIGSLGVTAVRIGNAYLRYDSTNNALYVVGQNGATMNFYATGSVGAGGIGTSEEGGSTVEWEQIQGETGSVKIATIKIDGVLKNVWAPAGGGGTTVSWGTEAGGIVPLTVGSTTKRLVLESALSNYLTTTAAQTSYQSKITNSNKLSASLIEEDSTHKFVTNAQITTWTNKADANHTHSQYAALNGSTSQNFSAKSLTVPSTDINGNVLIGSTALWYGSSKFNITDTWGYDTSVAITGSLDVSNAATINSNGVTPLTVNSKSSEHKTWLMFSENNNELLCFEALRDAEWYKWVLRASQGTFDSCGIALTGTGGGTQAGGDLVFLDHGTPKQILDVSNIGSVGVSCVRIGNAYLKYDTANQALFVEGPGGIPANFYAKGCVAAGNVGTSEPYEPEIKGIDTVKLYTESNIEQVEVSSGVYQYQVNLPNGEEYDSYVVKVTEAAYKNLYLKLPSAPIEGRRFKFYAEDGDLWLNPNGKTASIYWGKLKQKQVITATTKLVGSSGVITNQYANCWLFMYDGTEWRVTLTGDAY